MHLGGAPQFTADEVKGSNEDGRDDHSKRGRDNGNRNARIGRDENSYRQVAEDCEGSEAQPS